MRIRCKVAGLLLCVCISAIALADPNSKNIFVSPHGECSARGTAADPFPRLTDALAHVRELRAAGWTETVTINVAPGQYTVSRTPQDCSTEQLPIKIDVSDVVIAGATAFDVDPQTNTPVSSLPGGSLFIAAQALVGGEGMVLLTPNADGDVPQRVWIRGLVLDGLGLGGNGFFVDRAQQFRLQDNEARRFLNGIRTRGATGEALGNLHSRFGWDLALIGYCGCECFGRYGHIFSMTPDSGLSTTG